jgi:hypothetical protein
MRFPLGLAADLAIGRARQMMRGSLYHPLFMHLSVFAGSPNSPGPLASSDCLAAVRVSPAPVVWLGGSEPLLHPEIGRLARRIVDSGRHVFVTTDGMLLRRRIHEFRPVSRLFLTVQFQGGEKLHDARVGRVGAFRDALDGIRTAKLSGFLVCAQIPVYPDTGNAELREILVKRDVDGFIVYPGLHSETVEQGGNPNLALRTKLSEAWARIPGRRWRWFSQLLHESIVSERSADFTENDESDRRRGSDAAACEESVEAS